MIVDLERRESFEVGRMEQINPSAFGKPNEDGSHRCLSRFVNAHFLLVSLARVKTRRRWRMLFKLFGSELGC